MSCHRPATKDLAPHSGAGAPSRAAAGTVVPKPFAAGADGFDRHRFDHQRPVFH